MIEKPDISDTKIISSLREFYGAPVTGVEFLPMGNDPSAWSYRVDTEGQETYFLKIKKEISNQAGFLVPWFLQDHGITQVLAPLPTRKKELWIIVDNFFLSLYPFVSGREAMEVGMSDLQWKELGYLLKRIHSVELPYNLSENLMRETFIPIWGPFTWELNQRINQQRFDDPYQNELAALWKEHQKAIQTLLTRTEMIGKHLQQMDLEFVLCHADIHTANILLTPDQQMFIVDWDGTLLAPKERDLMFVLGGDIIETHEEKMFFDGYGSTTLNPLALAYYRYEWCVQEIGDYGKRVFAPDMGERTRQESVAEFMKLFSPGDVIDTALNPSSKLDIENQINIDEIYG
jgi:spectinomycin phosphotransferase